MMIIFYVINLVSRDIGVYFDPEPSFGLELNLDHPDDELVGHKGRRTRLAQFDQVTQVRHQDIPIQSEPGTQIIVLNLLRSG